VAGERHLGNGPGTSEGAPGPPTWSAGFLPALHSGRLSPEAWSRRLLAAAVPISCKIDGCIRISRGEAAGSRRLGRLTLGARLRRSSRSVWSGFVPMCLKPHWQHSPLRVRGSSIRYCLNRVVARCAAEAPWVCGSAARFEFLPEEDPYAVARPRRYGKNELRTDKVPTRAETRFVSLLRTLTRREK
jgi:hypothetical protein